MQQDAIAAASPAQPLQWLRSLTFNILFYGWTLLLILLSVPLYPMMGRRRMRWLAAFWERGISWLLATICGVHARVLGLERVPDTPVLVAAKHQSAWETLIFHSVKPDIAIGIKQELTRIPIFGSYLLRGGMIAIDRRGAARALKSLVKGAKAAVAEGDSILIFPEGTRRSPGAPPAYKSGIAAVYDALGVPCVPVALNSGSFWRRKSFTKLPGTITLEFLEPIPAGLDRRAFMARLEHAIEPRVAALEADAAGQLAR